MAPSAPGCVLGSLSCRRRASRAGCCRCCCALAVLSVLLVLSSLGCPGKVSPPGVPLQVSGRTPPPWRCVWGFRERTKRGCLVTLVLLRIVPHFGAPHTIILWLRLVVMDSDSGVDVGIDLGDVGPLCVLRNCFWCSFVVPISAPNNAQTSIPSQRRLRIIRFLLLCCIIFACTSVRVFWIAVPYLHSVSILPYGAVRS